MSRALSALADNISLSLMAYEPPLLVGFVSFCDRGV
jgi:hypothetical protein